MNQDKIGENNGRTILTDGDVKEILEQHRKGASAASLCRRFSCTSIYAILGGKIWKHIPRPV